MDFESWYRAVESRDPRFDGRVYVGVTSTGIYCRPICPVRMPRRENVRFYSHAAAAEAAGFRACRRCRPEASPGSPDWDVRADVVGRGLRLIAEGVLDREGVGGLARRLAVGPRHLHRLFVAQVGAPPLAVARSHRARLAKQLLEDTDLPSSEVAFLAGFASIRAYNDTVQRTFGRSPSQVRRQRRAAPSHGLVLRLAYRPPLAAAPLLRFLAGRAIPGVEEVTADGYRRTARLPGGNGAIVSLGFPHGAAHVRLAVSASDPPALATLVQAARRCADLDADPATVDAALATDPDIAPLVKAHPGLRVPGAWDGFECAVRAVIGQQVTVAGARTLLGRLVETAGERLTDPSGTLTRLFPTPTALLAADLSRLGVPSSRITTLRTLAAAVDAGTVVLDGSADLDEVSAALGAVPGIGPWTVAYVRMRALRDPDAFPATDLGVRTACERLGLPATGAALAARAVQWRPWRAYAVLHLWQSLAVAPVAA